MGKRYEQTKQTIIKAVNFLQQQMNKYNLGVILQIDAENEEIGIIHKDFQREIYFATKSLIKAKRTQKVFLIGIDLLRAIIPQIFPSIEIKYNIFYNWFEISVSHFFLITYFAYDYNAIALSYNKGEKRLSRETLFFSDPFYFFEFLLSFLIVATP